MKISIITCTYNSAKTVKKCIESINDQIVDHEIEHLFIDGKSTDGTLEIIQNFSKYFTIYSEPDEGIYDAFNKGLKRATGDIIGFLHSDDEFCDSDCLNRIASAFVNNPEIDYYCSKMVCIEPSTNAVLDVFGSIPHIESFVELLRRSNNYAHPTFYCKRQLIDRVGGYNKEYKVAADFDWVLRLRMLNASAFLDAKPLMKMYAMGASNKYLLKALSEEFFIRKRYEKRLMVICPIYFFQMTKRIIKVVLNRMRLNMLVSLGRFLLQNLIPDFNHQPNKRKENI